MTGFQPYNFIFTQDMTTSQIIQFQDASASSSRETSVGTKGRETQGHQISRQSRGQEGITSEGIFTTERDCKPSGSIGNRQTARDGNCDDQIRVGQILE
jgi:hypothetical protein